MIRTNMIKITIFLFIAVLITSSAISGTFAKYTTSIVSARTVKVASWDIKLNGENWKDVQSFNLFSSANTDDNLINGEKVVAPGMEGTFTFRIKNDSEVQAKYSLHLIETNIHSIPMEYKIEDDAWQIPIDNKITVVENEMLSIGSDTKEIDIRWRWAITGNQSSNFTATQTNTSDTTLGENGEAIVSITASIQAEQIN